MNKEKTKAKVIIIVGIISFILLMAYLSWASRSNDLGEYDYCVEWEGIGGGTLNRDSLLYTCYNLAQNIFYCDYEIMEDNRLMVKPIINTTYNEDGGIIGLEYDEPNYFNCTRWLKSR